MKWSLYIGKLAGIKTYIHWTFILLLLWIAIIHISRGHGWIMVGTSILFIVALFACITLHELGHALSARRYGIQTKDINLLPIGGVARLETMPDKPAQEIIVALAGPVVNLIIAVLIFAGLWISGMRRFPLSLHLMGGNFWLDLMAANIILLVFNLIPAYPMDGGRVLHGVLGLFMPQQKATRIAVGLGQFLAIGFMFIGFFYDVWLLFIGFFLFLGAGAELQHERISQPFEESLLLQLIDPGIPSFTPDSTISELAGEMTDLRLNEIVIAEGEEYVGVITHHDIIRVLHDKKDDEPATGYLSDEVIVIDENITPMQLQKVLPNNNQSTFPVVNNGKLIGIIPRKAFNNHSKME